MDIEDEEDPFCIQDSFQEQPDEVLENVIAGKYMYQYYIYS